MTFNFNRTNIIQLLKAYGFSAGKALEIAIGYERDESYSRQFVAIAINYAARKS